MVSNRSWVALSRETTPLRAVHIFHYIVLSLHCSSAHMSIIYLESTAPSIHNTIILYTGFTCTFPMTCCHVMFHLSFQSTVNNCKDTYDLFIINHDMVHLLICLIVYIYVLCLFYDSIVIHLLQ